MNVLIAICWGMQAWDLDVSAQTIVNCFQKALHNAAELQATQETLQQAISQEYQQLQHVPSIQDLMDINNFLNSEDEVVQDDPDKIDE